MKIILKYWKFVSLEVKKAGFRKQDLNIFTVMYIIGSL